MLQIYYKAFKLVKNFLIGKLVKNFFFLGISNKSFIVDKKFFMFAMMNTKYLKKITRRSYRRYKSILELKNRGKMCKTPCQRANKQGTNQQGFHLIERPPQHPRTYNYSVTSTLSTSRMSAPDSIRPLK